MGSGSSPRVWGTAALHTMQINGARFIPTGVGNRSGRLGACLSPPVHPHGCGEQQICIKRSSAKRGSSPRVWGTGVAGIGLLTLKRFIPTGVGNRAGFRTCRRQYSVHPHGCGEQCAHVVTFPSHSGSSPRVWGTDDRLCAAGYSDRFIPTGVGNSCRWPTYWAGFAVHPHGCGEQTIYITLKYK